MAQTFASLKFSTLVSKLESGGTSLILPVNFGITAGRIKLISGTNFELVSFTGLSASGSNFEYTGLTRDLSTTAIPATSASSGQTWVAGTRVELVAMHDQLGDIREGFTVEGVVDFIGTDHQGIAPIKLTTAQRTGLTLGGSDTGLVYDTDLSQYFIWE